MASQRVAQASRLKRQGLSPYARVGIGGCLRSSRFDAEQSNRVAALSIVQRNGPLWISHNRQKLSAGTQTCDSVATPIGQMDREACYALHDIGGITGGTTISRRLVAR